MPRRLPYAAELVLVFLAYFVAARVGLALGGGDVAPLTVLWPPSAVALAAVLILGFRVWPALLAADALGSFLIGIPPVVTLPLAAATISEPLLAAWILRARGSFRQGLDSLRSALRFVAVAPLAAAFSATLGIAVLVAGDVVAWPEAPRGWFVWWIADVVAILVITPFFLVWASGPAPRLARHAIIEALLLGAVVVALSALVFVGYGNDGASRPLGAYAVFPLLVWAALRFGLHGVVSVSFVASVIAATMTLRGRGPFWTGSIDTSLMPVQIFLFFQGVTALLMAASMADRERARAAVGEADARFRRFIETTREGVWGFDGHGIATYANERAAEMIGQSRADLLGRPIEEFLEEVAAKRMRAVLDRAPSNLSDTFDLRLRHRKGHDVWAIATTSPTTDDAGQVTGMFAMLTDISDRKRAQDELLVHRDRLEGMVAARTKELERANRELEAFSYTVSHDLRAPLRGIEEMSNALREDYAGQLDPEGVKLIERIRRETARMVQLVEDLLSLSQVTRLELKVVQVDLSEIARASALKIAQRRPELVVECVIQKDIAARADPRLIAIALDNLFDNAWKYSSMATHPKVEFGETMAADGTRAFFVRDNGAGFDAAKAGDKLFQPFGRLHSLPEYPGTGVGLTTVRRIVERHAGRVWAESVEGKGATFFFTLGQAR